MHDREEAVDEAEDEIDSARRRLDEVEIRLDALDGDLAAGAASEPDRVRADLVDLAEERGALKERIRSLETEYERAREDLRRYRTEAVGSDSAEGAAAGWL